MSDLVIDANVAVDWFIPSEPGNSYSAALADLALDGHLQLHVPVNFSVEVIGQLIRYHRRQPKIYNKPWLDHSLRALDAMHVNTHAIGLTFKELADVAIAYNLTSYDAAYLHMARILELPIASRDRGVIAACKVWHVLHWQP